MSKVFTLNKNKQLRKYSARFMIDHMYGYQKPIGPKIKSAVKRVIGLIQSKGVLVKENAKTVIVRLPDGNIIKRHKVKHEVK